MRQVLAGGDPNLLLAGLDLEGPAQLARPLQEGERMREEAPAGVSDERRSARPANLAIELDVELRLEREEPVAQSLLGDAQHGGGGADLAVPGDLHEGSHLVGAEVQQLRGHTTMRVILQTTNNHGIHATTRAQAASWA